MNNLLTIGTPTLTEEAVESIRQLETTLAQLKAMQEDLRQRLLAEMESRGIVKIDMPEICINYIGPTDRETFDSKALRVDNPDLYDRYVKLTPVKSSLRIKIK